MPLTPDSYADLRAPMAHETRLAIIRLSHDETLPEWFREACRKVLGDRDAVLAESPSPR